MKKKLIAAIFGAVLVLGACGGAKNTTNENGATTGGETAAIDAEKIVNSKCISCHGGNLEGAGGAPAINKAGATLSQAEIHDIIINGQGGMPGGIIKGEEADAVAKWLAEKK